MKTYINQDIITRTTFINNQLWVYQSTIVASILQTTTDLKDLLVLDRSTWNLWWKKWMCSINYGIFKFDWTAWSNSYNLHQKSRRFIVHKGPQTALDLLRYRLCSAVNLIRSKPLQINADQNLVSLIWRLHTTLYCTNNKRFLYQWLGYRRERTTELVQAILEAPEVVSSEFHN